MKATYMLYFTSDVHLNKENKERNQIFINWLNNLPNATKALYLLGDIFDAYHPTYMYETWCQDIIHALHNNSKRFKIYLMHGNHDFLIDKEFAKKANIELITQDTVIVNNIILLHGDTLATDDKFYQIMRKIIRSSLILAIYKVMPLTIQLKIIQLLKNHKNQSSSNTTFNLQAIDKLHQQYPHAEQLICGHFHKYHNQHYQTSIHDIHLVVLDCWKQHPHYYQMIV